MHPSPDCVERRALYERYHAALRAYIDATDALDRMKIESEFDNGYNVAMWARLEFERLREEYKTHMDQHGCG
jgi:hypothetical protein